MKEYSGLFIAQFGSNAVEELLEVDFTAEWFQLCNHVEDGWVFAFESKTLHGGFEFTGVNLSRGFCIEEVEGLP